MESFSYLNLKRLFCGNLSTFSHCHFKLFQVCFLGYTNGEMVDPDDVWPPRLLVVSLIFFPHPVFNFHHLKYQKGSLQLIIFSDCAYLVHTVGVCRFCTSGGACLSSGKFCHPSPLFCLYSSFLVSPLCSVIFVSSSSILFFSSYSLGFFALLCIISLTQVV